MITLNSQIPNFILKNQEEVEVTNKDLYNKWVLLYFYPKDDTPGCTKQACDLRDSFEQFKNSDLRIYGISPDNPKSHKKFKEKYNLPFDLLSDEEKTLCKEFGVWQKKSFMGKEYFGIVRSSFLINPNGTIVKIYPNVKPEQHAQIILNDIKELK